MIFLLNTLLTMIHGFLPINALLLFIFQDSEKQADIYDILWAVVFGFATLNIVGLALRRFETSGNRLNLGEILKRTFDRRSRAAFDLDGRVASL